MKFNQEIQGQFSTKQLLYHVILCVLLHICEHTILQGLMFAAEQGDYLQRLQSQVPRAHIK